MAYDLKFDRLLRALQYGEPKDAISYFTKKIYDVNAEIPYIFEDRKRYVVTPLSWAVRHNRLEICVFLLQNGAKPYNHMVFELYPLHDACNQGYNDIVQAFIDAKVDMNKVTDDFDTPLHIACMRGHVDVVHKLLRAGADCEAVNSAGRTPLEEASYHHRHDLVALFRAFNKDTLPQTKYTPPKTHASGAHLQRRHSYTSSTLPLVPLRSTPRQQHPRPQSFMETSVGACGLVTGLPAPQVCSRARSKSQLNGPTPTTSSTSVPLLHSHPYGTFSGAPQSLSTISTFISVTATDSPSPVECDGLTSKGTLEALATGSTTTRLQKLYSEEQPLRPPSDGNSKRFHSVPIASSSSKSESVGSPYSTHSLGLSLQNAICSGEGTDRLKPQRIPTTVSHSHQLTTFLRSPKPYYPHRERPLSESVSHPEFPLMKPEMIVTERTASCGDLYRRETDVYSSNSTSLNQHRRSASPPSSSREKIENLSKHMWDSLESVVGILPHQFKNPFLDAFQRVFRELAPAYDITIEQYKSLAELNAQLRSQHSTPDPTVLQSLTDREVEYEILEGPLAVLRQAPSPSYASLVFKVQLREAPARLQCGELATLKVIVKVYDLINSQEARLYHAISDQPSTSSSPSPSPCPSHSSSAASSSSLQEIPGEVATLRLLPPHPHIQSLQHYSRESTENLAQHARCLDSKDRPSAFAMHPTGDFLFFESHDKTLADIFSEHRQRHLPPGFGLSEEDVLIILAQLLLAIAHLSRHSIAHCAIRPENVFVEENTLILSNFSHAFSLKPHTLEAIRSAIARLQRCNSDRSNACDSLALSPEATNALLSPDLDNACLTGQIQSHFSECDSYAAGRCIYEFFLGPSHAFFGQAWYTEDEIPYLESLSLRCNKMLRRLIACESSERLSAIDAATCCLVLTFGPRGSRIACVEDCHRWIFSECMEFYMKPVLEGCGTDSTADVRSRLHYVYLTVADPQKIWDACQFFSRL